MPLPRLQITQRQLEVRLLWYPERVDWRVEWRPVVFTGESRVCLYASGGRTHVLRKTWRVSSSGVNSPTIHRPNMLGTKYRRMIFGTFMIVRFRECTPLLPPEGVLCVLMRVFGHPLLWHVCFIWSEYSITPTMINYLPYQVIEVIK